MEHRTITRRAVVMGGAVGAAVPLALAACGTGATPARQSGPVTAAYMSNLAETHPEGAARLKLLDEFNQTNQSKITVDVSGGKAATSLDKYKALAAAGTPPDFAYSAYYEAADMFSAGMLVDIDAELKTEKDWAKQRADIFPAMLDSSTWQGKLASIPEYTNDVGIIYNKGLLQQSGVAAPKEGWTWDDFKSAAQRFVRPDLVPFSFNWVHWIVWLRAAGGLPLSSDSRKVTVDTPEMLQVMELLNGFIRSNIMPADGRNELYKDAKNDVAYEMQGPYRILTLRQNNAPDFGVIHSPVHPQKKQIISLNGGHNVAVFGGTTPERQHSAALVAKWLNEPHAQALMCIGATSIPVSKAAMNAKELQEYAKTDAQFKGFLDLAPYGWRWPALPSYPKISKAINDGVTAVLKQQVGIKDGLARTQAEAQTLLDDDVRLMK